MSISIGIYDFFSYTIPGFLYLLVGNEILALLGFTPFDISKLDNGGYLLIATGLAFVSGHIFDTIGHTFWDAWESLLNRVKRNKIKPSAVLALEHTKKYYPALSIDFSPYEWGILQQTVTYKNPHLNERFDRYKASSIMMKSFATGLILLSFIQIAYFFSSGYDYHFIISFLVFFFFAMIANDRSKMFNRWFYSLIFEEALKYGKSVKEVLASASVPGK